MIDQFYAETTFIMVNDIEISMYALDALFPGSHPQSSYSSTTNTCHGPFAIPHLSFKFHNSRNSYQVFLLAVVSHKSRESHVTNKELIDEEQD
jgi:hypothetical protein